MDMWIIHFSWFILNMDYCPSSLSNNYPCCNHSFRFAFIQITWNISRYYCYWINQDKSWYSITTHAFILVGIWYKLSSHFYILLLHNIIDYWSCLFIYIWIYELEYEYLNMFMNMNRFNIFMANSHYLGYPVILWLSSGYPLYPSNRVAHRSQPNWWLICCPLLELIIS